ncbi:TetR/AcrR family transcriptional regulator [Burkholderia sp. Bp9142]|uniref:TetR/AcrR family transcriptional regulator n=1 Tax=Burkholderia sp. Bp9142 TaxID=2184573 RepID=UPI000F5AC890|nr:TetR/AcrR family transcriptional regulator [Burkholderia sp. Bp9142]RQR41274.1 TetR family transcriptional regulator [Burkholderia sp. Bp9142]
MARQTKAGAAQTRARVIKAAIEVFCERGVRHATLEEVAARAGVTRGAVYGHFSGKPALVAAIVDSVHWPLAIGDALSAYPAHAQPLRHLQAQLHTQMTRCLQDPTQWPVLTLMLREAGCPTWPTAVIEPTMRMQVNALTDLCRVMVIARERGQLRRGIAPVAAARCLHVVGVGMLSDHASKLAHDTRVDIRQCLQLFFAGIAAPNEAIETA